jgi:two-component system chemotaxis sensor kinase CheA
MSQLDFELDEVLKTFLAETEEQLAEMEEALVVLELQPDDGAAIQSIFRSVHTLKGNAASMGYDGVAELAHALEDLLDKVRANTVFISASVVTVLLRAIDALRFLVPAASEGRAETAPGQSELIADIGRLCGAQSPAAAATPAANVEGASPKAASGSHHQTLRVDLNRLDRMLDLSGEIAVGQGRLAQALRLAGEDAKDAHRDLNRLFMELQEEVLRARMVPLGPTFRQQIRTVRDAAQAAAKMVRLEIEGGEVEVDTTLVEQLRGPLTHMIRNAIDHGIELPQVRAERGKDPRGRITLRARHESGGVVIELADDGAGLNRGRIEATAKARGVVASPEDLNDSEITRLIFEPGFSTCESVTELSGRGIGMDVVRKNVEALRGSIDVRSVAGEGTTFSIRVPLTVAIIQGFLVESADETYVIPLAAVAECVDLPQGGDTEARSAVINLRGEPVPFLRLRQAFGLSGKRASRESLVVVAHGGFRAALAVDTLVGESQVVIKPKDRLLRNLPGIAGSTILGTGRVAFILDVPALLDSARQHS